MKKIAVVVLGLFMFLSTSSVCSAVEIILVDEEDIEEVRVATPDCSNSGFIYETHILLIKNGKYEAAPGSTMISCEVEDVMSKEQAIIRKYACSKGGINSFLISGVETIKCK